MRPSKPAKIINSRWFSSKPLRIHTTYTISEKRVRVAATNRPRYPRLRWRRFQPSVAVQESVGLSPAVQVPWHRSKSTVNVHNSILDLKVRTTRNSAPIKHANRVYGVILSAIAKLLAKPYRTSYRKLGESFMY